MARPEIIAKQVFSPMVGIDREMTSLNTPKATLNSTRISVFKSLGLLSFISATSTIKVGSPPRMLYFFVKFDLIQLYNGARIVQQSEQHFTDTVPSSILHLSFFNFTLQIRGPGM